ncbi:MAG: YjjI family glycine radical enzyme [Sphaerochaetaceae bacterium]
MDALKEAVLKIVKDTTLTHQQAMMTLADLAVSQEGISETTTEFDTLHRLGIICDMSEPKVPYAPRYTLPDYGKLLREGSRFLRLGPPQTLDEAIHLLQLFYLQVPSVTHMPVYLGNIDTLLDPFVTDNDATRMKIERFLDFIEKAIPNSFCHANIGPEETVAGRMIIEIETRRQQAVPGITLLYDKDITPPKFAEACAMCALTCAKPSFANHAAYAKQHGNSPNGYGIASCYNALAIGGGAYTLSRIVLKRAADRASNVDQFLNEVIPRAVDTLTRFMDAKIKFLVEESHFFKSNFLVEEGFLAQENFTGMFGVVGLHEAVNILLEKEGIPGRYGVDKNANELGHTIMQTLERLVKKHENPYCQISDSHFVLHAQVGIDSDIGISPGARIAIGEELPLYTHLKHSGEFHPYFPSGTGDIFPFDSTYLRNPSSVLDIIQGGFASGMRYVSTYGRDSDVIRITGYLAKRSDMEALDRGEVVRQNNVIWALGEVHNGRVLERKVRR